MQSSFIRLVLVLVGTCVSAGASAHPHVWVTVETEVLYDEQKAITGFRHKWTFDEAYSQFAVEGRDLNNDGQYDREELKELTQVNVDSLKEFDYFTFPKVDNKLVDREPPKDYWLEYHDDKLTLFFTLPLKTPIPAAKIKDFTFTVYDPTFYVEFTFAKDNPVRLSAAPALCTPVVKDSNPHAAQQASQTLGNTAENTAESYASIAEAYATTVSIHCPKT